jgi:hypothetical protein
MANSEKVRAQALSTVLDAYATKLSAASATYDAQRDLRVKMQDAKEDLRVIKVLTT